MYCASSFSPLFLSTYYVSDIITGSDDTAGNKVDLVLALMELRSQWRESTGNQMTNMKIIVGKLIMDLNKYR